MPLSFRNLIVACSLTYTCMLLATPARGQSNYVQPHNQLGISAYQSNQIIDHSSMSPDSWSAPPNTNAAPYIAPSTTLPLPAPANFPESAFQQPSALPRVSAPPEQANTLANGTAPTIHASPSIPDLGAATNQQTPQATSLIRQPGTTGGRPVSPQSPFRSAKYSKSNQTDLPLDNQASPVTPFQSNADSLPDSLKVTDSATGEFDLGTAIAPSSPTSPTLASPALGGAPATTSTDRYPLGINSNLPITPQSNELIASPSAPTHDSLVNQPLTTQPRISNYALPQPAVSPQTIGSSPNFRPDLGHRSPTPTFRGRDHDSGLKMDFEDKKKEYPGLGEILATGRYFGSFSTLFLQPSFQQNSVITQFNSSADAATFASSESLDFDYETAPRFRVGFESEFGPGVELDYWQFDQGSNISSFTSNGLDSGQLSSGLFGPSSLTTLTAVNAGDTLSAIHSIDIETFSVTFFKEIKFPISRLNGIFGFQYASVFQELDAELTDAGGNLTGAIRSTSDGERDQIVTNLGSPAVNRFGADEFVLTSDFYGGVQWKKLTAENRGYFVRIGVTHQSWVGGGSAVSSESNSTYL